MLTLILHYFLYAYAALWSWPWPWHTPDHGSISHETYDALVRYTRFASAVYQPLCPRPLGTTLVSSFTNVLTGTHGFVARDDAAHELIVAFRGSQTLPDMLTDASVLLVPFEDTEARVHAGFGVAYASVAGLVGRVVREQREMYAGYEVVFAGHSMGGAVAALGAAALRANDSGAAVRLYTFGQPRTGDAAFADLVDELVGAENVYRAVHSWDGVPTVIPESLGYRHHATEYWQYREPPGPDTVRRCDGQEDASCSASIPSTGINLAHDVYFGQVMTADATLCL